MEAIEQELEAKGIEKSEPVVEEKKEAFGAGSQRESYDKAPPHA